MRQQLLPNTAVHHFWAIEYNHSTDPIWMCPHNPRFNEHGHRTWTAVTETAEQAVWQFMQCRKAEYVTIHSVVSRGICTQDGKKYYE